MELWFKEIDESQSGLTFRVKNVLFSKQTPYQRLDVFETEFYGNVLVLDGAVQITQKDEFVYHEMLAHVPLYTHPNPRNVLIIGGGDGGTVREVVKHPEVEHVDLVEIDEAVIQAAKSYFPEVSCELDNPRVSILPMDGIEYIRKKPATYDVILIDSTDPVGPAEGLIAASFYKDAFKALTDNGVMAVQAESPFFYPEWVKKIFSNLNGVFPVTRLYLSFTPTYPGGMWTFGFASKGLDPVSDFDPSRIPEGLSFKYYTPELHKAAFQLPAFVQALTK
ncbi:MAG: spermidine synthase [Deltaproteobacteria bacterium]|nr:MAG: spermidine synthase [Deltaproteobacteria bacterium]